MRHEPSHFGKRLSHDLHWPAVELVDVTLRDGGFTVDFRWPEGLSRTLAQGASAAGAHYVELGYVGGVPTDHNSPSAGKFADLKPQEILRLARGLKAKPAVMIHPSAGPDSIAIDGLASAGVSLVRVVYHPDWKDRLRLIARRVKSAGLKLSVNLALSSRYDFDSLVEHGLYVAESYEPDILYFADTCSALFPSQVEELFVRLDGLGTQLGFHPHDFLSLALANSLAACRAGAVYVDAAIAGLGRGGGNLRTELWVSLALQQGLDAYSLTPLIPCLNAVRRAGVHCDPSVLSMLSAVMNLTPPEQNRIATVAKERQVDVDLLAATLLSAHSDELGEALINRATREIEAMSE